MPSYVITGRLSSLSLLSILSSFDTHTHTQRRCVCLCSIVQGPPFHNKKRRIRASKLRFDFQSERKKCLTFSTRPVFVLNLKQKVRATMGGVCILFFIGDVITTDDYSNNLNSPAFSKHFFFVFLCVGRFVGYVGRFLLDRGDFSR